jgi:hypothetical protein
VTQPGTAVPTLRGRSYSRFIRRKRAPGLKKANMLIPLGEEFFKRKFLAIRESQYEVFI